MRPSNLTEPYAVARAHLLAPEVLPSAGADQRGEPFSGVPTAPEPTSGPRHVATPEAPADADLLHAVLDLTWRATDLAEIVATGSAL